MTSWLASVSTSCELDLFELCPASFQQSSRRKWQMTRRILFVPSTLSKTKWSFWYFWRPFPAQCKCHACQLRRRSKRPKGWMSVYVIRRIKTECRESLMALPKCPSSDTFSKLGKFFRECEPKGWRAVTIHNTSHLMTTRHKSSVPRNLWANTISSWGFLK